MCDILLCVAAGLRRVPELQGRDAVDSNAGEPTHGRGPEGC